MKLKEYTRLVGHWVTRDGRHLQPNQIDNNHLDRILKLLEQWHQRYFVQRARDAIQALPWPSFNGEMAQMAAEHDFDVEMDRLTILVHSQPGDVFPVYNTLLAEKLRRQDRANLAWWQKK
jgi:hypothetical protein